MAQCHLSVLITAFLPDMHTYTHFVSGNLQPRYLILRVFEGIAMCKGYEQQGQQVVVLVKIGVCDLYPCHFHKMVSCSDFPLTYTDWQGLL